MVMKFIYFISCVKVENVIPYWIEKKNCWNTVPRDTLKKSVTFLRTDWLFSFYLSCQKGHGLSHWDLNLQISRPETHNIYNRLATRDILNLEKRAIKTWTELIFQLDFPSLCGVMWPCWRSRLLLVRFESANYQPRWPRHGHSFI